MAIWESCGHILHFNGEFSGTDSALGGERAYAIEKSFLSLKKSNLIEFPT